MPREGQGHVTFLEIVIMAAFVVVPMILIRASDKDTPVVWMSGFILIACIIGYRWTKTKTRR